MESSKKSLSSKHKYRDEDEYSEEEEGMQAKQNGNVESEEEDEEEEIDEHSKEEESESESNKSEDEEADESVKLLEFKKARKKAQEDAQALKNRIMLLEQENSKMLKKIKGTKKKAIEIMRIKNRKKEKEDERKRVEEFKRKQEEAKRERIRTDKKKREELMTVTKSGMNSASQIIAKNTKNMLKDLRENYKRKKQEERIEIKRNAQAIKNHKILAKNKKEQNDKKKRKEAKKRYVRQIEKELNIKDDIQFQIEELKKHENDLIMKLKSTGEQQNKAIFDLQKVLNGEIPTFMENEDYTDFDKEEARRKKKRRMIDDDA